MAEKFYIVHKPTPLYKRNNKDSNWSTLRDVFGEEDGSKLQLDDFKQVDPLETSLREGDVIKIIGVEEEMIGDFRSRIFKVMLPGSEAEYYTDARFINEDELLDEMPPLQKREIPPKETIFEKLNRALGLRYIWGGTRPEGFPKMLELYPPSVELSDELRAKWTGAGVDCSGLLYYATDASVPRNTRELSSFGVQVDILGKSLDEIIQQLDPLDIIVWTGEEAGHVIIILDKDADECIENRHPGPVQKRSIRGVLEETIKKRNPVNEITDQDRQFVVRRWHGINKEN